jgi:V/A-type H+/Na+-transporting ATPase subunit E
MADIDGKTDKFSAAINHYAEEQRRKIEQDIQKYKEKELQKAEMKVLEECYQLIQSELAQMRAKIAHENAIREIESRRKVLQRRNEITAEVFEKVKQNLKAFTEKEAYPAFLQKTAANFAKTFGRPGVVIRLRAADAKYESLIRDAFGFDCTFMEDNSIEIGGLKASHPEMGIFADETLDTLMTNQYDWFEANSGMAIL